MSAQLGLTHMHTHAHTMVKYKCTTHTIFCLLLGFSLPPCWPFSPLFCSLPLLAVSPSPSCSPQAMIWQDGLVSWLYLQEVYLRAPSDAFLFCFSKLKWLSPHNKNCNQVRAQVDIQIISLKPFLLLFLIVSHNIVNNNYKAKQNVVCWLYYT